MAYYALIDRHLYLPESWIEDRNRCREAGIPEDAEVQTKPRVALDMLQRAIDAGVPFSWFTADEAFGQVKYLLVWLEEQDVFHVVPTRCNDDVSGQGIGYGRVDAIIDRLPARAWRRMSCGDGAHGPRVYDWVRVHHTTEPAPPALAQARAITLKWHPTGPILGVGALPVRSEHRAYDRTLGSTGVGPERRSVKGASAWIPALRWWMRSTAVGSAPGLRRPW